MDEMMKKLLMSKKDKESMSDQEKQAKMDVLMELLEMAQGMMGNKVKSGMDEMHKVSVMAKDPESLKEGLEKAEEVVEEQPEMLDEEPKEESSEKPEILEDEEDDSIFNKLAKKSKE